MLFRSMIGILHGFYIKEFKYYEKFDDYFYYNNKMLGYLRFCEYDEDLDLLVDYFEPKITKISECQFDLRKAKIPAISINNEKRMLTKLKLIAEKYLNKFPQTYDEDMKLLKCEGLSFN